MPSGHGVFRVVWLTPWVKARLGLGSVFVTGWVRSRFWLGFVSVTCWVSSRFRQAGSGALNIVEGETAVYYAGCEVRLEVKNNARLGERNFKSPRTIRILIVYAVCPASVLSPAVCFQHEGGCHSALTVTRAPV